jgi:hypothetical protein
VDRPQYTLYNRPNITVLCTLLARGPRGQNRTRYIGSLASCCLNKEHDIIVRQSIIFVSSNITEYLPSDGRCKETDKFILNSW